MEQKIYERQIVKKRLSLRVVDEQQIDRYFDKQEVNQLYQLEEDDADDDDCVFATKTKCQDELMNDLLRDYGSAQALQLVEKGPDKCLKRVWIKDVEIPQDLLQHNIESELSAEQQKTAEKNYELFCQAE